MSEEKAPSRAKKETDLLVQDVEVEQSAAEEAASEEIRDPDFVLGRIKSLEKEIKELKTPKDPPQEVNKPEEKEPEVKADFLTREEAKLIEGGYSLAEVDFIKSFAKASGMPPTEAISDAGLQAAIKAKRDQANAEAATPEPSTRTKSVKTKLLSDMSQDERREHYSPEAWKARREKAG